MAVCDWEIDDNDGSNISYDRIATQLAAIAAKINAILASLRDDAEEIKVRVIGDGCNSEELNGDLKNTVVEEPQSSEHVLDVQLKTQVRSKNLLDAQLNIEDQSKHVLDGQLKIRDGIIRDGVQAVIAEGDQCNCSTRGLTIHQNGRLNLIFFGLHGSISKIGQCFMNMLVQATSLNISLPTTKAWEINIQLHSIRDSCGVQEADQVEFEWLIAWHKNFRISNLRTS